MLFDSDTKTELKHQCKVFTDRQ